MRIPRSYIENYSRALNAVSERARSQLAAALMQVDYTMDVAAIREVVASIMQVYCGASSTLTSRIAADFYDGLRARFDTEDGYVAEIESSRMPEATEGAVRAFAQDLVDGKPVEQFVGKCVDRLDYETRRAANECMAYNARRDPRKPKWARVPTGAETCEFCIMLASRGFAYQSEDTASHAHANCDCRVVPSWDKDNPMLEGYDVEYYKDCYEHPDNHPEVREAINARRRELYAESVKSDRKAERKNATLQEVERRRVAALSDEAKVPMSSRQFTSTFGHSVASDAERAIDDAMKSGDAARINAARLLSRDIRDGFEVASLTAGKSCYHTETGRVEFTPDGATSFRTIAHELAHRRDFERALSYVARKITADGEKDVGLTTSAGAWSSTEFEHGNRTLSSRFRTNSRGVTPAWRDLKRRLGVGSDVEVVEKVNHLRKSVGLSRDEIESLSDIINAASGGKVSLGYGHPYRTDSDGNPVLGADGKPVPYWNDTTRTIETWADYSASLVSNGRESRLIRELFPDECAIMDAMMEVMV